MAILLKDVHHASVENRPMQFRTDTTWRFMFPMMGWTVQSARGFVQAMGRAPTDSRSRLMLAAASVATVLGFAAAAILTGETEKDLKKTVAENLNGEVYPEKGIGEARDTTEAAKLAAIDAVAWMPQMHNLASELLGESQQTVNEMGVSIFPIQEAGKIIRYIKGAIVTGDPSYGLAALGKSLLPLGRRWVNEMDSQKGLVALKNARTIVQKFGPEDLLGRQQSPEFRAPTELSPLKQALDNAVYRGDAAAVSQTAAAFEAKAIALGKTQEEAHTLLRQAMASIDPISIGGRKMTDAQHQDMLARLGTGDAAILSRAENNWNQANKSLGLEQELTKGQREPGGSWAGSPSGAIPMPGTNRLRRTSNRFRLPRGRSGRVRHAGPKTHVTRLRHPSQTYRIKKPRNRLRRRSTIRA